VALDGFSGATKWRAAIGAVTASPALAPDGILFAGVGDTLYALQASAGPDSGPWTKYLGNLANSSAALGVQRGAVLRSRRTSDGIRIDLYGGSGGTFLIERSDRIGARANWEPWLDVSPQAFPATILDVDADSKPARFYRAKRR
jgi:hypothetical protein